MFTGIVEELGTVKEREESRLVIAAARSVEDADIGSSIAVNGCCLTVVEKGDGWWAADVSEETFRRTNLGEFREGSSVNLERPVRLADRLGGHLVQGHVDAVGTIAEPVPGLRVSAAPEILRYLVPKGSVTLDGVSLTVVSVSGSDFTVAVIPHTAAVTTLGLKTAGDTVNIEVDVIAKYVERFVTQEA